MITEIVYKILTLVIDEPVYASLQYDLFLVWLEGRIYDIRVVAYNTLYWIFWMWYLLPPDFELLHILPHSHPITPGQVVVPILLPTSLHIRNQHVPTSDRWFVWQLSRPDGILGRITQQLINLCCLEPPLLSDLIYKFKLYFGLYLHYK